MHFLSNGSCPCPISFRSIISLLLHLLILVALHPLTIPIDVINLAILLSNLIFGVISGNVGLRGYNLLCLVGLGSVVKILDALDTMSASRRGDIIDLVVI